MPSLATEFVHPTHLQYFIEAAQKFGCHILVRKTGLASLSWVGQCRYTGKPVDMKAKTSDMNSGRYLSAGLVCSPILRPSAFSPKRLTSAKEEWAKSIHLIHIPEGGTGFEDDRPPRNCPTPYILQNNLDHKHFGCVAFVEKGLVAPQYVHGDYDLYDIMPSRQSIVASVAMLQRAQRQPATRNAGWAVDRPRRGARSLEGPLLEQVANYINGCIAQRTPSRGGVRMVNHGEQVNLPDEKGVTFEPVLAFYAQPKGGDWFSVLETREDHAKFYGGIGWSA